VSFPLRAKIATQPTLNYTSATHTQAAEFRVAASHLTSASCEHFSSTPKANAQCGIDTIGD